MIIPVRCFTCGKVVADKFEQFKREVRQGEDPSVVLDNFMAFAAIETAEVK
jgi:DNA-directed RNA polymerase subunit N